MSDFEIEPSPFFAKRVMAAVQREAQFAPLPFPWFRFSSAFALLMAMVAVASMK